MCVMCEMLCCVMLGVDVMCEIGVCEWWCWKDYWLYYYWRYVFNLSYDVCELILCVWDGVEEVCDVVDDDDFVLLL